MTREEQYEQIEAYINGKMTDDERQEFKTKMNLDSTLQQEVQLHQELSQALSEKEVMELENLLAEVGQSYENEDSTDTSGKVVSLFRKYRALAAAVAILVVGTILFQLATGGEADLYAKYHEPFPSYLEVRSGEPGDKPLQQAIDAYKSGDYATAKQVFDSLPQEDLSIKFYASLSALEAGFIQDAIKGLEAVASDANATYRQQAEWYLALAYLKNGDLEKTRSTLQKIVQSGSDFEGIAKNLLKEFP